VRGEGARAQHATGHRVRSRARRLRSGGGRRAATWIDSPRTMLSLAFCPGDGKATPSAAAVKSVEIVANQPTPGAWQSFVFHLPADKANLKIEKLSGDLKIGGRLAGKITGAKKEGEQPYSWDVDFDLALPAKAAAAGPSCGS
jgi:hypothetical protein